MQKTCNKYSGEKRKKCDASLNAFLGAYVSNETDINEKLSKMPSNTNFLYFRSVSFFWFNSW